MTADLVDRAERRTLLASTLGRLLLAEPGPGLAQLVAPLPELAQLADTASAADYERVFLRSVPPYESAFRSDDGRQGGAVAAAVADVYAEAGFDEHEGGQWRVAGPDHLGLELRCHADLVGREGAAWAADRPDEAALAVEEERRFLADHLATWAAVAIRAMQSAATGTPYAVVLALVDEFLMEEVDRLRPAPLLGQRLEASAGHPPTAFGPARLARHLLAPGRSGVWIGVDDIAAAAVRLGFPWRPMDGRGRLRQILDGAAEAGELPALMEFLHTVAADSAAWYRQQVERQPGTAAIWSDWAVRAEATADLLAHARDAGLQPPTAEETEVVLRVCGPDVSRAAGLLEAAGFTVSDIAEDATHG